MASRVVSHLRATFDTGRTRALEWRRDQLGRLDTLLRDHEDELTAALTADLGKSAFEGYSTELGLVRTEIAYALAHLDEWAKPVRVRPSIAQRPGRVYTLAEPKGVALVIGAWNYPVQLSLLPLAAALAAGNCVVVKPSEVSATTSSTIARLLARYLDADAVAVVEGGVDETTALLGEQFDHIFYTGNGRVGRLVMQAAAEHLTPVTLELGGKSPAIVDRRANLRVAARRIAWGKYLNAGQTCIAPDYVLVDASIEHHFLTEVVRAIHEFYGDDPLQSPDYGCIINQHHFGRLVSYLGDGVVVEGGVSDAAARYIAPTVLTDVDTAAPVMIEEIFGPILPVLPVASTADAIDFVNGRDKPLALYVFSDDVDTAHSVLARTSSGGACVNATLLHMAAPNVPFGGVGPSGMGRYHGYAGFETFSHVKSVYERPARPDLPLAYPPYGRIKRALLRRFL